MHEVSLHVPPFQSSWKGAACMVSGLFLVYLRSFAHLGLYVSPWFSVIRPSKGMQYVAKIFPFPIHVCRFEVALAKGTFVYYFRLALNGCCTCPKGQGFISIYMWGQHLAISLWFIDRTYSPVNSRFSCEGCLSYRTHNP